MVPFPGSFWIRVGFFFLVIHSGMSVSWKHPFILIASLSWMEVNFLNQNPCMPSRPGVFWFGIFFFFECCSKWINVYIRLRTFFNSLQLFFHFAYPFCFFVMILPFPYFTPKLLCIPCIQLQFVLYQSLWHVRDEVFCQDIWL